MRQARVRFYVISVRHLQDPSEEIHIKRGYALLDSAFRASKMAPHLFQRRNDSRRRWGRGRPKLRWRESVKRYLERAEENYRDWKRMAERNISSDPPPPPHKIPIGKRQK